MTMSSSTNVEQATRIPGATKTIHMVVSDPFDDDNAPESPAESFVLGDEGKDDDLAVSTHFSGSGSSIERTIEHEQEAFETQQHKATDLILALFPGHTAQDVKVERMNDGSHNCVIGITLSVPKIKRPWYTPESLFEALPSCLVRARPTRDRPSQTFVLHITHNVGVNSTPSIPHQVATLAYLGRKLSVPIPKVVVFDSNSDNALASPYLVQERSPGTPLTTLWATLNTAQRCSAAHCIATLVRDIHRVTNPCAGVISIRNTTYDINQDLIHIEPTPIPFPPSLITIPNPNTPSPPLATPQTPHQHLLSLTTRHKAHAHTLGHPPTPTLWPRITHMLTTLPNLHTPTPQPFHLHLPALNPTTLLAQVLNNSTIRISALLNAQHAVFAPAFMGPANCDFFFSSSRRQHAATIRVTRLEKQAYARVFEEVLGGAVVAVGEEVLLARRLYGVLMGGLGSGAAVAEVEGVLRGFEGLYPVGGEERG